MNRTITTVTAALACLSGCASVQVDQNPVLGTWRLRSFVREVARTGERYDQLGPHPDGYVSYSSDGRMYVMLVAGDQPRPVGDTPTDAQRIQLHKSMLAYGGTYTVDAAKGDTPPGHRLERCAPGKVRFWQRGRNVARSIDTPPVQQRRRGFDRTASFLLSNVNCFEHPGEKT